MKKAIAFSLLVASIFFASGCGQKQTSQNQASADVVPPKTIATFPDNGSQNVDPALAEIWVKFDESMMDKGWSWAYDNKDEFPELTGDPSYSENYTKCSLPVKLESNKQYVIWINTEKYNNFKDKAGNSAVPYKFTFKTK